MVLFRQFPYSQFILNYRLFFAIRYTAECSDWAKIKIKNVLVIQRNPIKIRMFLRFPVIFSVFSRKFVISLRNNLTIFSYVISTNLSTPDRNSGSNYRTRSASPKHDSKKLIPFILWLIPWGAANPWNENCELILSLVFQSISYQTSGVGSLSKSSFSTKYLPCAYWLTLRLKASLSFFCMV